MSQFRRSFEWLRGQWNAGGGAKRAAIVLALLFLWPFVLIYGMVALIFEIIASLDRSSRFSTNAHWAIATVVVVGVLLVVSALTPTRGARSLWTSHPRRASPPLRRRSIRPPPRSHPPLALHQPRRRPSRPQPHPYRRRRPRPRLTRPLIRHPSLRPIPRRNPTRMSGRGTGRLS